MMINQAWIQKEINLEKPLKQGDVGPDVRRVQEWLCLQGIRVVIDGDFGPATAAAVRQFQAKYSLPLTGMVDKVTFSGLSAPLFNALYPPELEHQIVSNRTISFNDLIVGYAKGHLAQNPREVGGENRGPWVRLYMRGNQGSAWPWCAGFASFIFMQAAGKAACASPLPYTFGCDELAAAAKAKGMFVPEGKRGGIPLPPGSIFLRRKSAGDWTHTGLVMECDDNSFQTIEGNTNDDGNREGYEVCRRIQGYAGKDFIRIG